MGRGRDHRCRYLPRRPTVGAPVPPLMVGVCMLYVDRSYINRSFLWCALAWTKEKWNADQATTSTSHPLRVQRVATRRAPPPSPTHAASERLEGLNAHQERRDLILVHGVNVLQICFKLSHALLSRCRSSGRFLGGLPERD